MTQTALNHAVWSFFLSCFLLLLFFFDAWYERQIKRNKTRKAAEIHASRLTENEENLFSIQKGVSIKTRMLEKR